MQASDQSSQPPAVAVGIARGRSVAESISRAVALAGGLSFIQAGQTVLVKPNVNSADPYPATTNPEVVYEAVKLLWERDPRRIIVGDRSGYWGATLDFMRQVGIFEAAKDAKAEVIPFDDGPWQQVRPEGASHWTEGFRIPGLLSVADHVVSIPVLKTHRYATYTMALKNAVGMVHPEERLGYLHTHNHAEPRLGSLIAEINLAFKTSFVILDGTRAFVSGGPASGELAEPRLILASADMVAIDAAGLAVLKSLGTTEAIQSKSVWQQPQLRRAVELGLGLKEPGQLQLVSDSVAEIAEIEARLREE